MWHTSYMMNSFSFGWWLNRVYSFNDPDHLVMGNRSDAENISRVTTAIVTSYCILGDNLSTAGSAIGDAGSQRRASKFFTYERINDLINMRLNFRPAYGHKLSGANNSIDLFSAEADDSYVIVHFNYSMGTKNVELDLSTLGIDASTIDTGRSVECWTGASINLQCGKLSYTSPNDMARVFRLYKK
jgi:alpha-galactosidase